ncbi:MAG: hypothetical protein D6690_17505 [Nitrospirae bacterium]|nr:MAG: hypothetical protein D6690_17505 [Nitrospirota bacterium]
MCCRWALKKRGQACAYPFLIACLLFGLFLCGRATSAAQVIGEAAELDRLIKRADEAIANGDPETASVSIGKAALMASILAERTSTTDTTALYKGAEALFRAQENGYRALALFDQAGGRPPASSSTCRLLALATRHQRQALEYLARSRPRNEDHRTFHQHLLTSAQEWTSILPELRAELACP